MTFPSAALSVLAVVVLSASAAACGGESDKSGGDAPTISLRMAALDGRGAADADNIEEFARQVEDLSGGRLRIRIIWKGAEELLDGYGPRAEQDVAALVQTGELAAALIPARAWDELGVTSLQALQAPFLVSSDELLQQIVESELAGEMLAGLDEAGVVGLTLLPGELRHPVGFARPFLTAADFAGARIRAPLSNASYRLLEALAAKPVDICCEELTQAAIDGSITGAESAFIQLDTLPWPGPLTANITFYPRVNVIVVNQAVLGRLSDEHREILREAAAETLRDAVESTPSDVESAALWCRNGGTIAFASDAAVARLERAATPVYEALEADAQTRELIAKFRRMKEDVGAPGPLPEACTAARSETPSTSVVSVPSKFPQGVYRAERQAEDLIEQGLPPATAHNLAGLVTLTFEDGRWRDYTQGVGDCRGPYTIEAGRIVLHSNIAQCHAPAGIVVMSARWRLEDGRLRFFDFTTGRPAEWRGPWTKID